MLSGKVFHILCIYLLDRCLPTTAPFSSIFYTISIPASYFDMAITSLDRLPSDQPMWKAAAKKHNAVSIHNVNDPHSASEITVPQYLALKVVWPHAKQAAELRDKEAKYFGFEREEIKRVKDEMYKDDGAWKKYLRAIEKDQEQVEVNLKKYSASTIYPLEMDRFVLMLQNQREVELKVNGSGQ